MRFALPAWIALLAAAPGCRRPAEGAGDAPAPACEDETVPPPGLVAAGSGSNLALVRAIARRYERLHPGARVSVPESIGTGGAVAALADDAIDIGLASRPLTEEERRRGLVETPLAGTILAFAADPDARVASLGRSDLVAIYSGRRTTWPDGSTIVPLLREPGDSGERLLAAEMPDVAAAMARARDEERWTVCYTDREMLDALLALEGALGFVDVGTMRLEAAPLAVLAIDGVEPTPENALAGRCRFVKPLSFVTDGPPAGETAAFIEFARSAAVADILERGAFLAPGKAEP
jgi:phosphate transport system substrate-binding protein